MVYAGRVDENVEGPFFRFAKAFETSNQMFRVSSASDCRLGCDANFRCSGVFEFIHPVSGSFSCFGLQDISGKPIPTNSLTRSFKKRETATGQLPDASFSLVHTGKLAGEAAQGLRFSTAFDAAARLFDVDNEVECVARCSAMTDCLGYFLWLGRNRCFGLSDLGVAAATSVSSSSYKKDSPPPPVYKVVSQGVGGNDPPRRFSTAFSSSPRLFVAGTLVECTSQCDADKQCLGVFFWKTGNRCYGLSDLGTLVPTGLVGVSYQKVPQVLPTTQPTPNEFLLSFKGKSTDGKDGGGRFTTAFRESARLFTYSAVPLAGEPGIVVVGGTEDCKRRCLEVQQCLGVFEWVSMQVCYGLSDLGLPQGGSTLAHGLSWTRLFL